MKIIFGDEKSDTLLDLPCISYLDLSGFLV